MPGRKMTEEERVEAFWSKVNKETGACWWWTASQRGGYGGFWDGARMIGAHCYSWEQENGPIPDGMCICHHCDNGLCVNPDHLFLGTHQDNMRDASRKGRMYPQQGEENSRSVLTDDAVCSMRAEYAAGGTTHEKLAAKHGVSLSVAHAAIQGKTWKHVE